MPTLDPIVPPPHIAAFTGYGIELEYMIVDRETLAARPMADVLLVDAEGNIANEVDHDELAWSNELVRHVVELKTNGPTESLKALEDNFHADVVEINRLLEPHGACLMPTAMHPLFDPDSETRLWPFGQNEIYAVYNRIFDCRGHGWSNLQSMHINLPFADDAEFTRLHAAIRAVLPLIPALSAASPFEEGRATGWMDTRLRYYRDNQREVPEISGRVIPEAVTSIDDYHARILQPMYRAIAPHDPGEILADDWLNSRAAIARFERQTIEIRIIDLQECPAADLAIARAVVALIQRLYEGEIFGFDRQQALEQGALADLLFECARRGSAARIEHCNWLDAFGIEAPVSAGLAWRAMFDRGWLGDDPGGHLQTILEHGTLAERIKRRTGNDPDRGVIVETYRELVECLAENRRFLPRS
ncbi:MAG TPA: glutamate-cysteine ligase family protein [Wenzhouxiangellaceae bacterium]|nr:glutamate-cysteine ligase family protein [Wenzhouxiangellaceae bacterium]